MNKEYAKTQKNTQGLVQELVLCFNACIYIN